MIRVEHKGGDNWLVTVEAGTTTTHEVTVTDDYYRKLTSGRVGIEALLKQSFEFLLARESNTSILRQFELPVIGRYFPEYESTIEEKLS